MRRPWTEADDDVLEELLTEHDYLSCKLGKLERRIHTLRELRGNPELRELDSDYWAGR
jgi:hypothetical protein